MITVTSTCIALAKEITNRKTRRFIHDLSTDEELDDDESSEGELFSEDSKNNKRLIGEDDEDAEDEWISEDSADRESFQDKKIAKIPEYLLSKAAKKDLAIMTEWEPPIRYRDDNEAEFMTFMDREKSKGKTPLI